MYKHKYFNEADNKFFYNDFSIYNNLITERKIFSLEEQMLYLEQFRFAHCRNNINQAEPRTFGQHGHQELFYVSYPSYLSLCVTSSVQITPRQKYNPLFPT